MYGFRLTAGTAYVSPLHMNYHLKLRTLRLYLLNLNRRLQLRPLHHYQVTEHPTDPHGPPPASLMILIKIR
jgi:hypothetical protein